MYTAYSGCNFEQGAERLVFHCHEIKNKGINGTHPTVGPKLVAKQTRFEELTNMEDFHIAFCR